MRRRALLQVTTKKYWKYKVIIKDSESVKTYIGISQNGNKVWNLNHVEKKLASYIQDNYSGKEVKVDIGVQNTSVKIQVCI